MSGRERERAGACVGAPHRTWPYPGSYCSFPTGLSPAGPGSHHDLLEPIQLGQVRLACEENNRLGQHTFEELRRVVGTRHVRDEERQRRGAPAWQGQAERQLSVDGELGIRPAWPRARDIDREISRDSVEGLLHHIGQVQRCEAIAVGGGEAVQAQRLAQCDYER